MVNQSTRESLAHAAIYYNVINWIAIDENLQRKNLSDREMAIAIKEYDDLKRKMEGERKPGGDRQSICYTVANDLGWTHEKTAQDLGVSRQAVTGKASVTL